MFVAVGLSNVLDKPRGQLTASPPARPDQRNPHELGLEADRNQLELRPFDLDSTIVPDHRARLVWRAVETLDLRAFYDRIKARVGTAGPPPGDPKVFVALWLYATTDGVGSARDLERLCAQHQAYRWLCGGVPVNHHTLSDFRVEHGAALDDLLTQTIA